MKKIIIALVLSSSLCCVEKWQGTHYQVTSRPQYEMAQYVLTELLHDQYKTILDIGCGSGDVTQEMSKNAQFTLGVDYSESMITRAKASYGHINNLVFQVADIRSLSHIEKTFDLITSFHTVQWIPAVDQDKAFCEMADRLNLGGTCIVLVSDRFNVFYDPLMKVVQRSTWQHYFPQRLEPWNWQTVGSVSRSFEKACLRPLKVFVWYKKYHFDDKASFLNFMTNWFYSAEHFNHLSEGQQDRFFNEIIEQFLTSISYKEGIVEFESPFVIGIAQKHIRVNDCTN